MRLGLVTALTLAASTSQAELPSYANLDSILYAGLVFIGGTDHKTYAYLDTIRVIFLVENSGPSFFWFPLSICRGAGLGEIWCPTPDSPATDCVPMAHDDRRCSWPDPPRPRVVEILPGRTVFYEAVVPPFHDFVIPPDWSFRRGHVVFDCPYQPPYWKLTVPYLRQRSTSVRSVSWSAIKALYR